MEVYRGAGINERQNPFGSPSVRKPETHRRAGLHLEPDNFLTDILTPVMQLPNSGNFDARWQFSCLERKYRIPESPRIGNR